MGNNVHYRIVRDVARKTDRRVKTREWILGILIALAVVLGFVLSPWCFLAGGVILVLDIQYIRRENREYEYILQDGSFLVQMSPSGGIRREILNLSAEDLIVLAPVKHELVTGFRKADGSKAKKIDCSSHDGKTPVDCMIIRRDGDPVRVLLDQDEDMLRVLERLYPDRVHR